MQSLLEEITAELKLGFTKKGHPFRYFSLATKGLEDDIGLRTVALRNVSPDLRCTFYSDSRSNKIKELIEDSTVSALFLHPKKLWQITLKGNIIREMDTQVLKTYWNGIPLKSRKDYTTKTAPGSKHVEGKPIEYITDSNHFSILHIIPEQIEILKLERPSHVRVRFSKTEGAWYSTRLVP
ncbi:pyridoxamine 5'-phosphate oxidase family protein [Flagellimonas meridianipacifica]|uniref:Pyridoxine/pyridoxamine 5'-phosphate oxidase n=1 Tax=Flagellimonas meridianipacifica TaxID=1080225 RepID=A0A2T0MDH4_9FLAO|nr:pyridoxamine 5'-phosphate oxidase family protein [Allomuricauda pacifica]PRX55516.1 pyridoxine/pyridoxamine 5'-phosphate oxidase [Allomuricauda pacifica]